MKVMRTEKKENQIKFKIDFSRKIQHTVERYQEFLQKIIGKMMRKFDVRISLRRNGFSQDKKLNLQVEIHFLPYDE